MKHGWTTVALGDLVDFYSGGTPSKSKPEYWQGDVPWFSAKDMKAPRLADSIDRVSEEAFTETPLRRIPAGTIAMVVRGMILAHTVPISILDRDCAINQDLKALIPRRPIDTTFLAAMIRAQHDKILAEVSRAAHGTTKIESHVLASIEIPLPPLDEQRCIAAVLDHVDILRAARRRASLNLESLTDAAFERHVTSDHMVPLGDLVERIDSGRSPVCLDRPAVGDEWSVLKLGAVSYGFYDADANKAITRGTTPEARLEVRRGDVLLSRKNTRELVGMSVHVRDTPARRMLPDLIFRLVPLSEDSFAPAYMARLLRSRRVRPRIQELAGGSAASMVNVSKAKLLTLPLPIAPIAEQRAFDTFDTRASAAREAGDRHLKELNALFASVQARAFAGELDVSNVRLRSA
jgi:type I restriction enzyme, S subunit